jgi:mono/diheme cytochrome c family protein
MKRRSRFWVLGTGFCVLALGTSACTDFAGHDIDMAIGNVPWLSTMRQSIAYGPQSMPRHPVEGTVPVASPLGDVPEPYTQADLETVGATLVNPLPRSVEVLQRGALVYERQCYACHGPDGNGQGPVVGGGRFPFAPAIGAGTVPRSEGYIYAVTDVGRGLMPAYGYRIPHLDRWAVAAYVRYLQEGNTVPARVGAPAPVVAPGVAPTQAPTPETLPLPVDTPAQVPATQPAPVAPADTPAVMPPAEQGTR